jgi:hypothetical protein
MKSIRFPSLCLAGVLIALGSVSATGQVVEFRATINAAQETTPSTSEATGSAVLLYDVGANRFDLTVTINNLANPVTASHLHEGAAGAAGGVVTGLGDETVYTRDGSTVTATFRDVTHGGSPATLLRNGVYFNLHTASYPGGEVRGQLLAQPVRLTAILDGKQEGAANTSEAYGAALITYNPGTNMIVTRLNVFNFTNTLTNSHYHAAAPGASGPVVHGLGGAAAYWQSGSFSGAIFPEDEYEGDPVVLLSGGAYLNVHSNIYPAGEIRGQVRVAEGSMAGRLINISARGWVGTGEQVLIGGMAVAGEDPVAVLLTVLGPSLSAHGVQAPLANPMLSLHDLTGRQLLANDDHATGFPAAELAMLPIAPTEATESAMIVILPPGLYSGIVTGAGGTTGVALVEAYDLGW